MIFDSIRTNQPSGDFFHEQMLFLNLLHVVIECQSPEAAYVLLFYVLNLPLWCIVVYFVKPGTELHGIAFL